MNASLRGYVIFSAIIRDLPDGHTYLVKYVASTVGHSRLRAFHTMNHTSHCHHYDDNHHQTTGATDLVVWVVLLPLAV
jgi:hypothetical protein